MRKGAWQVHYAYEDQKRHSDQSRCQPCLDENSNTDRRANKSEAHQIDPKGVRGNPAWNEGRNIRRVSEMLGTKNGHGNRKKQSTKPHDLVDPMFLRQFIENFDEADDEKQRRTNIHPECDRRHAKRRGSQSRYDDNELLETAQLDLQRWTPPVNSSGDILEFPTKGGNHLSSEERNVCSGVQSIERTKDFRAVAGDNIYGTKGRCCISRALFKSFKIGQSLRSLQLIHVRLRHDQVARPFDLLLVPHIELRHANRFRNVDFVLHQVVRRRQLHNPRTDLPKR